MENKKVLNIAASWPAIVGDVVVNEHALENAQILPQLLHEASEEAQQQQLISRHKNNEYSWSLEQKEENEDEENEQDDGADEEQLQNMLENYQKHVIRQKQRQNSRKGTGGTAGRSASHLQRRINASQQPPVMSHSQPCLLSSSVGQSLHKNEAIIGGVSGGIIQPQQQQPRFYVQTQQFGVDQQDGAVQLNDVLLQRSPVDPREIIGITNSQQQLTNTKMYSECNGNGDTNTNELTINQLKTQNEKLRKKCERLEELERACKRIERDYDQVTAQHERREELQKMAIQKLEQQLGMLSAETEQLRAQSARLNTIFGVVGQGNESEQQLQMQLHFLLNELIPKNEELLLIQERQRIELEAQSATLEEQRTHIEVLEKALSNAQERLAAKERSAVDAVAVVDKCSHLQRMLQEALEDKQRQKEENGRLVAQLEMELTQLRLQFAKDSNSSAIGSIGRKSGAAMAIASGTATESGMGDEMLKLRKTISVKDDRISQLENGLLEMQRRYNDELKLRETASVGNGLIGLKSGGGRRVAELETLAIRLEQEKFEKERRIHELLDEKCHIQMQWNEERRSLDYRVRLLEKDLRHFMGSQSSLASSSGGGGVLFSGGGTSAGLVSPYGAGADQFHYCHHKSPYSSMRDQNLRHRSTAELPTSARVAALYEEKTHVSGLDVLSRMEGLGRRMAERRAQMKPSEKSGSTEGTKLSNIARPSEIALSHYQSISTVATASPAEHLQLHGMGSAPSSQHPSIPSRSSSSTDQPSNQPSLVMDLSPSSEEPFQQPTNVTTTPNDGETTKALPSQQQRQSSLSATSSASSSTKKRYFVSATTTNHSPVNSLNVDHFSDQIHRHGDRLGGATVVGTNSSGGEVVMGHGVEQQQQQELVEQQQQTKEDISISNGGGGVIGATGKPLLTRLGPPNRRGEGGCRRLIRDHSIDARRESRAEQQHPMMVGTSVAIMPPNYQESQQRQPFRRELGAPPPVPNELPPPYGAQKRQMHKMSSIEEPLLNSPQSIPFSSNYGEGSAGKTVVEVKGEEGDSDTLNSHRQLVYRRSSLGNANAIK